MDSSTLAAIAAIGTLLVAVVGAAIAYREWLHKTSHWLYIPEPNRSSQDPLRPTFWVFPPVSIGDFRAVVIAGKVVNAGPSDAFSVRIFAEREFSDEELRSSNGRVRDAVLPTLTLLHPDDSLDDLQNDFLKKYRTHQAYTPVLRVGAKLSFVVIAKYAATSPFISHIEDTRDPKVTCEWALDGVQMHMVCAESRTIVRRKRKFGPGDLCAPFEPQPAYQRDRIR
jgi:hypothetical protein